MGRCLNKCLLWGALGCFDQPDVLKNWSVGTSQTEGCRKSSVSAHQVQRTGLLITRECLGWWDSRVMYKENGKNESTSSARRFRGQGAGWLGEAHSMWDEIWTLWWTSQFIWKESRFSLGGCIQFNTNRLPLVVCAPARNKSELPGVSVKFEQFYLHLGVLGPQVCQSKHTWLLGIFFVYLKGIQWEVYVL